LPGLAFDDAAAVSYGILAELTERSGRQVRGRALGLMIAAVPHSVGAALATANTKDFSALAPVLAIILSGSSS
jgi:predicted nucleic acid-binding protein